MKRTSLATFLLLGSLALNESLPATTTSTADVDNETYQIAPMYDGTGIDENVDAPQMEEAIEANDDFSLDEDIDFEEEKIENDNIIFDDSQQKEEVIQDDQIDKTRNDMFQRDNNKTYNEEQSDDTRGED